MHRRAMTQTNKIPLISRGNQSLPGGFASSSGGQASLTDDSLPPTVMDMSSDVTDNQLPELVIGDRGNNQGLNRDVVSENVQRNEQLANNILRKRKHNHRHTQHQIERMEAFFRECPHPNENQRRELGNELGLDPLQIKFWFQNKRTQIKAQELHKENFRLRSENDKIRSENNMMKKSIVVIPCENCGHPCTVMMPAEEYELMLENARLKQEYARLTAMAKNGSVNNGKALACLSSHSSSLNHGSPGFGVRAVGRQLDSIISRNSVSRRQSFWSVNSVGDLNKSLLAKLALSSMKEFTTVARIGEPLWELNPDGNGLVLNEQEYFKMFRKGSARKPVGFKSEASRECAIVMMNSANILEIFMELSKWLAVFSGMISQAMLLGVVSSPGGVGNYDGAMQVISAEFQVLSPVVPIRDCIFLRYCKQLCEGAWAVVDVSIDALFPKGPVATCQRRPSGCIIQALPNGYSKITWVEHVEVRDQIMHNLSHSIISSGYAYGSKRWISILERQCERIANVMGITNYPYYGNLNERVLESLEGRQSVLKLAERMVLNFCGGVTASSASHSWTLVSGNGADEVRIMTRKNTEDPGRPGGIMLTASVCFWIPVLPEAVLHYLRNKGTRAEWDILTNGGSVQEMACISNGREIGNCVTILKVTNPYVNQGNMLILQESSIEPTASYIVYSPVDVVSICMLFGGGNPDEVQLLPSGFTIIPSGTPGCGGGKGSAIVNGTLLSMAIQILVDATPSAKPSVASVATLNRLMESMANKIKTALGVD